MIISSYYAGKRNGDWEESIAKFHQQPVFKTRSLSLLIPTVSSIHPRIVASWLDLAYPMNSIRDTYMIHGEEVGVAYSKGIELALKENRTRFLLTLEHDMIVPRNAVLKLIETIDSKEGEKYSAISGLYWGKGKDSIPHIWGSPNTNSFECQQPIENQLVPCNGVSMGCTLFRMDMFRDERLRKPWFVTYSSTQQTQDLYFWEDAIKYGYKAAVDCSVRIGHYEESTGIIW